MIILYIMLVTIAATNGKSRLTDRCPSSILQWKRQERLFPCAADDSYHCILKYNTSQLYEACIPTVTIGPGVVGCPWILFHQGVPIHGSKNSECPITNPECPPPNHKGYLSNQLYQYPACFMQRSARLSHGYNVITTEPPMTVNPENSNHSSKPEDANKSQRIIFIAIGTVVIVAVILIVVCCLFIRGKIFRSSGGKPTKIKNEKIETIVINDTGLFISEIGNGTCKCTDETDALISSNAAKNDGAVSQKVSSLEKNSNDWSDEEETSNIISGNGTCKCTDETDDLISSNAAKNDGTVSQKVSSLEKNSIDWSDEEETSNMNSDDPTCPTDVESSLNQRNRTNNLPEENIDEDVVQKVFNSILEMSDDGVVSYQQLLMHFVEKEDCSDICVNLENILKGNKNMFRLLEDDNILFVIAYLTEADICENYSPSSIAGECVDLNCEKFHVCTFHVKNLCRKQPCVLPHTYDDAHNTNVKEKLHLSSYTDSDINKILRNKYPKICIAYDCDTIEDCPYLHICSKFCFGKCSHGLKCRFGHSFRTEHNAWILNAYGISEDEIRSRSSIARKLTMAKNI